MKQKHTESCRRAVVDRPAAERARSRGVGHAASEVIAAADAVALTRRRRRVDDGPAGRDEARRLARAGEVTHRGRGAVQINNV